MANRVGGLLLLHSALVLCLTGCKPEPTGGLVAADRPAEAAAETSIAAQPAPESSSTQPAPPSANSSAADQAPPPPSIPIAANPGLIPVEVASGGQQGSSQSAGGQSGVSPASERALFRLSAGVAVPQSLPTGTAMGMSVDYQAGGFNQSSRYVWVVSSEGGGTVEQPFQPRTKGTLQTFFLDLRPEHRPFNSYIEEVSPGGRRTRVSNVAAMQTNY